MEESVATEVVEMLRARDVFAHVNRRAGVYNVGVRLVIPGGREVIWDNDGAAGLEAMVLRDGDLVGFVPQLPDSDDLTAAQIAAIIAATDYDAPPAPSSPSHPTSGRRSSAAGGGTASGGFAGPPPPAPGTSEASAAATGRAADEAAARGDAPRPSDPPPSRGAPKPKWTDRLRHPR
jgi:hypothetical protein